MKFFFFIKRIDVDRTEVGTNMRDQRDGGWRGGMAASLDVSLQIARIKAALWKSPIPLSLPHSDSPWHSWILFFFSKKGKKRQQNISRLFWGVPSDTTFVLLIFFARTVTEILKVPSRAKFTLPILFFYEFSWIRHEDTLTSVYNCKPKKERKWGCFIWKVTSNVQKSSPDLIVTQILQQISTLFVWRNVACY